jgi:FtsP/CotA-like multicopper oxidase with cupredoxin domain
MRKAIEIMVILVIGHAYTLFAQAIDRSGYTRGTLTPDISLKAEIPSMDKRPVLGMMDMGMGRLSKPSGNPFEKAGQVGYGSNKASNFSKIVDGPHVDMFAPAARFKLNDPGIGLRNHKAEHNRKVLTYADIFNLYKTKDMREPGREIELHLTGNMARYMWSMNGIKFADAKPLMLKYGERVRITLHNDTMMTHPIHLHGMWSELETGEPNKIPRKHTIIVQPGAKVSYLVTADAMGGWEYHCHLLYHMAGMFRTVIVS